jgi:hypothetical protein
MDPEAIGCEPREVTAIDQQQERLGHPVARLDRLVRRARQQQSLGEVLEDSRRVLVDDLRLDRVSNSDVSLVAMAVHRFLGSPGPRLQTVQGS